VVLHLKNEAHYEQKKTIALGLIFGTLIGVLTDNIGLWLSLGVVFGVAASRKFSTPVEKLKDS